MKACSRVFGTVAALGVFAACIEIAERDPSLPGSGAASGSGGAADGGNGNSGGKSSGGASNGGTTSVAGTSSGGGGSDSGGSSAGSPSGGAAGASGAGGSGEGGTPSSNCGSTVVAQGLSAMDALIDDFEDGNSSILDRDGRAGSWFLWSDGTGASTPAPGDVTPTSGDGSSDSYGILVTGSDFTSWGVSLSTSLVAGEDVCYDASVYTGLRLVAGGKTDGGKNYGPFYVSVQTAGVRALPGDEQNFHQVVVDIDNAGIFVIYDLPWSEFQQLGGWGQAVAFDPREIYAISILAEGPDIEFAIDDVEFMTD